MGTQVPGGQDSGWPNTDVRFALVWQNELTFLGLAFLQLRFLQFQECADVETQLCLAIVDSNCACVCDREGWLGGRQTWTLLVGSKISSCCVTCQNTEIIELK